MPLPLARFALAVPPPSALRRGASPRSRKRPRRAEAALGSRRRVAKRTLAASLRSISETIAREAENGGGASSPLQFEPPSRDGPFASPPSRSRVGATLEKTADQPHRTAPFRSRGRRISRGPESQPCIAHRLGCAIPPPPSPHCNRKASSQAAASNRTQPQASHGSRIERQAAANPSGTRPAPLACTPRTAHDPRAARPSQTRPRSPRA